MSATGGRAHSVPEAPGPIRYHAVRLVLWAVTHAYVRFRDEGRENIPDEPYILCINHPSWLDPVVLAAAWPDSRRLSIFGPRERDMSTGLRNHLINWTRRGVPVKPGGVDVIDATRRATAVLRRGDLLVVAGEGRLSDEENRILPLETGVAHFAMLAGVPVLPTAVIGTRWVHLGSTVRFRIGRPIRPPVLPSRGEAGLRASRDAAAEMTLEIETALQSLLDGVVPAVPPGRLGRLISDAFSDRPWLTDAAADPRRHAGDGERQPPPQ